MKPNRRPAYRVVRNYAFTKSVKTKKERKKKKSNYSNVMSENYDYSELRQMPEPAASWSPVRPRGDRVDPHVFSQRENVP